MLVHVELGFRHALQILDSRPASIAFAFFLGELRLNVDQRPRMIVFPDKSTLLRIVDFLPLDDRAERILGILLAERVDSDLLLESVMIERDLLSFCDFLTGFFERRKKRVEIIRLLRERVVDRGTQIVTVRRPSLETLPLAVSRTAAARVIDYRELMFDADQIAEPRDGFRRAEEITEF